MAEFPDTEDGELLAVLASYGVIRIWAEFDGAGDSGQIDTPSIKGIVDGTNFDNIELTEGHRTLLETEAKTVRSLVDEFLDRLLERTGIDWYNNDGGYGEIEIVPGEGRIFVDMNERYTSSTNTPCDFSIGVERDCHG